MDTKQTITNKKRPYEFVKENKMSYYHIMYIDKKNGKKRKIFSPKNFLKRLQHRIKIKYESNILSKYAYGFIKNVSIADCARNHVGKKWIIKMDIYNFFPSIKKDRLKFLTEEEREIVTVKDGLVQGSPCSPVLSNIFLFDFDETIGGEFEKENITYSRYADDIILSGNGKPSWSYVKRVEQELLKLGLKLNYNKIKFEFNNNKQVVLGINVNNSCSISLKKRKILRAKIHQGNMTDKDYGLLAHIKSVNEEQYNKIKSQKQKGEVIL